MNFFKKLFGKEEPAEKAITETAPILTEEVRKVDTEQKRADYAALVRLLSQSNQRAEQGMLYALDDRTKYLEQYQQMFSNWFSEVPTIEEMEAYPVWELFSYVLYDEGYLTLNDWKSEAEDFIYFFEQIVNKYSERLDHDKITDQEEMAPEIFMQIKEALPKGFVLLNIDIDSDSYQLTVVPTEKVAEVSRLAKNVDGKLEWY